MLETDNLNELRESAVFELDQMDKAFAITKNFSQMFDGYMRKIQKMVSGLLEADLDEEEFFNAKNTIKFYRQPSMKKEPVDKFRKGLSFGATDQQYDTAKNFFSSTQKDGYPDHNSFHTGHFNSGNWGPDQPRKDQGPGVKADDQRDESLFSALHVQTQTINKIIEAGELNSKNLREILEKVFAGKETSVDSKLLANKVQKLKEKLIFMKKDLQIKDKENQQLKIEIAVNQKLKQEIEGLYNTVRQSMTSSISSQKLMQAPCSGCETLKHENALLVNQLESSLRKIDMLGQNVEHMKNEFMDLYKTTQDHLSCLQTTINDRRTQYELDDSDAIICHNIRPSMDSNLNMIMNKLDFLEAGIMDHTNILKSDYRVQRFGDYSYDRKDTDRLNGDLSPILIDKSVELRYSSITNPASVSARPNTEHPRNYTPEVGVFNNFTVPYENDYSNTSIQRFPDVSHFSSQGAHPKKIDFIYDYHRNNKPIDASPDFTEIKTSQLEEVSHQEENIKESANRQDRQRVSEERYSIVEMSNSMENSLEEDDNPFEVQPHSNKQTEIRISFAKKDNINNRSWADPRSSINMQKNEANSLKESDDMIELASDSEDVNVGDKFGHDHQFYTFSNHHSERNDENSD